MADTPRRFTWQGLFVLVGRGLLRLPTWLGALLPVLWMGLIWRLSSQTFPPPEEPSRLWEYFGNLAHAPLFGFLALFWCVVFLAHPGRGEGLPPLSWQRRTQVLFLVALYGAIDEWHQSRTPGRDPSLGDWFVDVVGAACVLWIVGYLGSGRASESALRKRLLVCMGACLGMTALGVYSR